jgi:hypothetical protein
MYAQSVRGSSVHGGPSERAIHVGGCVGAALGADYDQDAVLRDFKRLDVNGDNKISPVELQLRSIATSKNLMYNARHGLLSKLLREDEYTLRLRVRAGELPASVLAVLIVIECSYVSPSVGTRCTHTHTHIHTHTHTHTYTHTHTHTRTHAHTHTHAHCCR